MCPVKRWIAVVQRIRLHKKKPTTNVNCWFAPRLEQRHQTFSQDDIRDYIRMTTRKYRSKLPYDDIDVGSHSIRSGAAMALYMANISTVDIMLLGRWSSDAFMKYLRPHIQEATRGLASKMILLDTYHIAPITANRNREAHDPLIANDPRRVTSIARERQRLHDGPTTNSVMFPRLHVL